MTEETQKGLWMTKLSNRVQSLMNALDMPADMALRIKDFVFEVAREQYRAGNTSGIRWARSNPSNQST